MRPLKRRHLPLPQIHLPLYLFGGKRRTHSTAIVNRMLALGLFLGRQRIRGGKGSKPARIIPLEAEPVLRESLEADPIRIGKAPIVPERVCVVPFCARKHSARGYCNIHYKRRWKKGLIPKCETLDPEPRTSELDLIEYVLQFGDAFYPEHHHDSSAGKIRWVFDPTFPTERLRNAILDAEWWRLEEVYSPDYYSTMREEFERSAPSAGYPAFLSERPELLRWNTAVWHVFLDKMRYAYGEEAAEQIRTKGLEEGPVCALEALRHVPDVCPAWAPFLKEVEWGWTRSRAFERMCSRTQQAFLLDCDTPEEIEEELVDMEGLEGLKIEYPDIDWEDLATETGVLPPPAG